LIDYKLITTQPQLEQVIAGYQEAKYLFLDTEFIRQKTYYAVLGLVQIFDGQVLALIDPCADLNLEGLWQLIENQNIVKVLHSAHEDLEIFIHYGQRYPKSILDTQIIASFCGHRYAIGYAQLVEERLGVKLDKTESRTNWLQRPLTAAQLRYAAEDVFYLEKIFFLLEADMNQAPFAKMDWIFEEMDCLIQSKTTPTQPELAYLEMKHTQHLQGKSWATLQLLCQWRLETAIRENKSPNFIIKEKSLLSIATQRPKTLTALHLTDTLPQEKKQLGSLLVEKVLESEDMPIPESPNLLYINATYKKLFSALKENLKQLAIKHDIPVELLSSKKIIHQFLKWHLGTEKETLPVLLTGWRKEVTFECIERLTKLTQDL
jgi:ribonuclease D